MPYIVEPMRLVDIPEVHDIELASFSSPWSMDAYYRDLTENKLAHYLVVRDGNQPPRLPPPRPAPASLRDHLTTTLQSVLSPHPPPRNDAAPRPPVVGFAGMWLMLEDAHLVTIAVKPDYRGRGLGELLLVSMLDWACSLGAHRMTLEVRVSNHVAQDLYRKYGFTIEGVRRRYYSDNGEDALIMTTPLITSAEYQAAFQEHKAKLLQRVEAVVTVP